MARTKPKNEIITREQAEDALRRIDEIDRKFADWDLKEAEAVAKIRERFIEIRKAGNYAGMEAERKLLVKELEDWADEEKKNWKGKTLAMQCGKVGYRLSSPTVKLIKKVCKSFAAAVEVIKADAPEYVRVKEELDREAVLSAYRDKVLDDEFLEAYGLKVDQKDEFWIESQASKDLEEAIKKLKAA